MSLFSRLFRGATLIGTLLSPLAQAAPSPSDYVAKCRSGDLPFPSPQKVFKDHGLDIGNACPFQTQVDKAHECQDAAQVLQNMYDLLRDQHRKTCEAARAAAAQAERDCQSQDTCLAAQQAALAKYQTALNDELQTLKDYSDQADTSMTYAIKDIAGGGVWVLHSAKFDASKSDDGTHHYGPDGRGGAADFLHASSNDDAVNNVMRGEDEDRANAVVQKFLNNQGSDSDITGLKSPLIREPLALAQAGRDWKQGLISYQRDLEGRTAAIQRQGATLRKSQQGLGSLTPNEGSSLSGTPTPSATPASGSAPSLAGLAAAAQAASSIAKSAPKPAGSAAAESLPSLGLGGSMDRPVAGAGPGSPLAADPASPPNGAVAPSSTAVATPAEDGKVSSNLTVPGGRPLRHAQIASVGSGASRANGAAPGKAGEGGEAAAALAASLAADARPAGAASGPVVAGASDDGRSLSSLASDLPDSQKAVVPESNEKIVQGIVGDWEKALHPDTSGEPLSAGANEVLGGESPSLFSRVRVAHERAWKRGSLVRTPSRL